MPKVKSKAQQRWFYWAEKKGKLKKGTARRHARKGKAFKKLPARVKRRKRR